MNETHIEKNYIQYIKANTNKNNFDNISRTKAYFDFYRLFPEIKWAFLASMVSRNAGWNITDTQSQLFTLFLSQRTRTQLFSTYERANWLIFSDAYPQLLIYQLSKQLNRPLFRFLPLFDVSIFMQKEWEHFWENRDKDRLLTALIINEQNVISQPVTEHPFYRKNVFLSLPYVMQDFFHMSAVLFPTRSGYIYASSVNDFTHVSNRIQLGKKLASVLFNPKVYYSFYDFALHTEHTGSRKDYERYLRNMTKTKDSPILRLVYPSISHQDNIRKDWFIHGGFRKKWWKVETASLHDNDWTTFNNRRKALNLFKRLHCLFKK